MRIFTALAIIAIGLAFAQSFNSAVAKPLAAESVAVTARDWIVYPAIVQLPQPASLYALGDVHADQPKMLRVLRAAKLIDPTDANQPVKWTGEKAMLVLTGDFIDKGPSSLAVITTLRILQEQAEKAGGRVILCLGNHEAEFIASGGTGKKSAGFQKDLMDAKLLPADVAAGKDAQGIGQWLRNLPAGAKVGDWFFCHAGNTHGMSVADLESNLQKSLQSKDGFNAAILSDANSMLQARMHPRPWFEASQDPSLHDATVKKDEDAKAIPAMLLANLKALEANHLVIGHQPGEIHFKDGTTRTAGQIFAHFDGRFFMIDTGMSGGVNGGEFGGVLKIDATGASAIQLDATIKVLWNRPK